MCGFVSVFLCAFLDNLGIFVTIITNRGLDRESGNFTKGKKMKKTLFVLFGLVVLAGCSSYDYYKGDVRYVQDGEDCIFTSTEAGYRYSSDIRELNADKEIVYRNTMCRDLYLNDVAGQVQRTERQVLTTVAPKTVKSDCGCCQKKTTKKYVFVK